MSELELRFYFAVFLRRLPYFLAIAISVTAAAIAMAYFMPAVYRASAKILMESPQISATAGTTAAPTNAVEQLEVVQQQIMTRDQLLPLADKLGVERQDETLSTDDVVDDLRARINFEQLPLAAGADRATVFNVSFDADDPDLAASFVNELVAIVLSKNSRLRTDRAENTTQFFSDEVARLGSELKRLEAQILKFKNEHQGALPDDLEFRRNKQSTLQERLLMLEREEAELRSRRSNLVELYGSTGQIGGAAPLTPEQQQLQEMNHALSEQLAIFSEDSPGVAALRARITSIRRTLRSGAADGAVGKGGLSDLDLQLSDIDNRLASSSKESTSLTQEIVELTRAIEATPANETVLTSLERDRTNAQTQYNAAIARLAEASTGEQIEALSKGPHFSVLDPATPPQQPVSPHRRRIAALGGVAGIGLGIGFIVLLEMLNKTIRRPTDIQQMFDVQPLATIPYIRTDAELLRARLTRALALLVAVSATAAGLLAGLYYLMPLGPVLERLPWA